MLACEVFITNIFMASHFLGDNFQLDLGINNFSEINFIEEFLVNLTLFSLIVYVITEITTK